MAEPAPALDFDVGGALKAGYTEHEIASYLGGQSGFDVESARKAGYNSTEIIHHLAPPAPPPAAKEEVAPQPVSGTALGMAKAAGQTVLETVPKLEVGVGAIMKSAGQGEAVESRRDIDLMHRLDQGEDFGALMKSAPNDLARLALAQYRRASPEEKATMRQDAINTVAAPPGALERGGANVLAAGQHGAEEAKRLIPLTPEEEGRTSVVVAKTAASLLTFLAAAGPAGVPGMVAYGGVESYGKTYEEAKKAGASDEDATVAAAISGVVQGGLNAVPAHKALAVADQIPKMFKGEFIKTLTEMAKSGGTLLGFTQVSQLADNYIAKETFEPTRDLKQGLGENMGPTFGVGALLPVVPAVAARAFRPRTPAEVAKPVMEAKTTDEAIAAAQRTVAEGTPVDISEITRNAEYGTTTEQNQARLLKLFGGMNEGTVEQAGEGAYHYRTEVDGQEQTVPLKVWDPAKPLAEGETTQATISPDLAAAQRKHYDSLGVKVVYFENDARIPFDGAVDPRQPDTIFLSNDPQRNAAQIGAHEVTHLLENTKLPDGTNLGDLLHDQVRAGMTPEGRAYAEKLFGGTAPKREAFGPGVEGDSAHADAVVKHLITELGADIGAEAPKFQTFAPRVVEAIEQRYGAEAAKGVLQKLIAGFKNALDTMRNFFSRADEHPEYGQTPTVSQHWVANLGEIHDTLAQMYAARFGDRVERENVALIEMRNKAQRERFLATGEAPQPGYVDPLAWALTLRRWHSELQEAGSDPSSVEKIKAAMVAERERLSKIGVLRDFADAARSTPAVVDFEGAVPTPAESPQTALLKQTEAAILGKVNGVEDRLTQAQRGRLEAVRSQLAEAIPATTPTPQDAVNISAQGRGIEVVPKADIASRETPRLAPAAAPRPLEAPPLSPFATKVKAERERLWAEEMPGYKRDGGTTRQGVASQSAANERMVTDSARDKVMREEIGEDAVMDAIERGLTDDQIFAVARFYRPEEGKTPQESFRDAVDRYAALEHEQALREEAAGLFDPDYDALKVSNPELDGIERGYRLMEEANARERAASEAPFESGEADGNGRANSPEVPERQDGTEAGGQSGGRGAVSGEEQRGDALKFSPRQDERKEPFYSALTRGVEGLKLDKATPGQWEATIRNMPGVKAEERAWSGVEDWLKAQAKSVTKAEVLEHLRENEVQVSEIEKRAMPSADMQRNEIANRMYDTDYFQLASSQKRLVDEALDSQSVQGAKFSDFTLPGGENYRELLLTLPDKAGLPGAAAADNFRGVHWNEPNVLAHVRFNDRTVDGKRTLFLEEVQSDWHQRGRQNGYSWGDALSPEEGAQLKRLSEKREAGTSSPEETQELRALHERQRAVEIGNKNRVPDAPFKTTWPELAMKRMLRYAAENGYEAIAWAPGAAHVERFSEALRKEVDHLEWEKTPEGIHLVGYKTFGPSTYHIEPGVARWLVLNERDQIVETHDGRADAEAAIKRLESAPDRENGGRQKVVDTTEKETVLSDAIGKALGQKIISDEGQKGTISGKDLRIDDTGMAGFYDRILPSTANKIGKKFGAKVEEKPFDTSEDGPLAKNPEEAIQQIAEGQGITPEQVVEEYGYTDRRDYMALANEGRSENTSAHVIPITPAMRESVMQGQPLFSPRVRTPEQIEADKAFASDKTVMEKLRALKENLPEKAVIATLDRFYGIKNDDPLGYMGLRLSNNAAGATEAFMTASTLRFDGRTYNWKERTGGVEALVKGLGVEAMDFAKWIAGHRAEILKGEGRENLLNDTQIRGLKSLNQGSLAEPYTLASGNATMSREAAYLDALKKYHDLNKNVMDLAVEGGLITRKAADDLLKNPFYIPFYRVDPRDGDQFVAPNSSSASVKQTAFKKLKGGTEQLNDLWENATSNWAHLIEASLKNKNTILVLKTAVQQGAAVKITAQEAAHLSDKEQKANTVWVMENGEKQFYRIEDKGLFAAVSVLDPVINIPVISPLARGAKNLLQTGITMNPAFAVRNVIRDTQQVIATTPISWNVANNLYTGFKENNAGRAIENLGRAIAGKELKDAGMSDTALSALASGALMRFGDVADAGVRQTKIKVGNRLETPEAVDAFWEGLKTAGGAYRKMMAQSEDVSRIALFKQLKDQGLPTDFAAFSAKDIADFSLTGAAQLVRTLNSMSAFTNARMQGLYKVARSTADADGNVPLAVGTRVGLGIAKRVATVVLAGMLVDLGLDALYANDEDWKKRDEFDKNSNYWFKIGKTEFRIPKGFEVGAVSRLGAIFVESFYDKEMTAGRALTNAYSLLANNLNLNPTPTILKPALDIYGNSNAASGNPIVPRGLERLQAEQRYTINNTMQARGLSAAMNATMRTAGINTDGLSPIQIDYLARAYGGWLATTSMQMGDTVARSFTSEPVRPAEDRMSYWTGGIVSSEPRSASRYVNMLYEQGDGIEKAYATYRDMLAQGHAAEAQKFFAANKDELQKHGLVSGVMRLESNLNKQIRMITNNPDPRVTAEQKHLQIQHLQAVKSRAAEQVFGAH